MQEKPIQASALMPVIRKYLWLPCVLLPGLLSAPCVSASIDYSASSTFKSPTLAPAQSQLLAKQRKTYKQAEEAFKKKHFKTFKRLSASLKNYPLYPYLEYKQLTRSPSKLSQQQVSHFFQQNDDTVIGDRFRLKMIKHYARTAQWRSLIDIYQPGFGVTTECLYLQALINTQQSALAYPRVKNLWLSPKSQPKTCDPAFKHWQASGFKTPEVIWQRFELAMSDNNLRLARYLTKLMPSADARIARFWQKVHRSPELISSNTALKLKHKARDAIILHGIKRMSRRDINKAIQTYQKLKTHYTINPQHSAEVTRRFGLQLARNHMPEAGIWLGRVPDQFADKQVKEWRIRTAIRQGDWSMVIKGITSLELDKQAKHRWQYWWAYANEQLGNTNDAKGIYHYLASKRSFYGFLAADHLKLNYSFEDKPVEPLESTMTYVINQPETMRAREFYLLGQTLPARREWHRLIRRINNEQKLAASKLAQSWNWHDRAIITMGKTRYRDDIELRFPLHHVSKVNTWSRKHKIDPAWTYAIIRRESAFVPDARSSVGAMGLMQLMPSTARFVARQMKIRYQGYRSLLASNTNIRLGTGYLGQMFNKLKNQHVLATAAYNAGPHRVERWLPEQRNMDAIRWIETIPFTETREYVSNVFAYMAIYEHRMNRPVTRLSHRMPPVPAKNPQLATPGIDVKQTAENLSTSSNGPS